MWKDLEGVLDEVGKEKKQQTKQKAKSTPEVILNN